MGSVNSFHVGVHGYEGAIVFHPEPAQGIVQKVGKVALATLLFGGMSFLSLTRGLDQDIVQRDGGAIAFLSLFIGCYIVAIIR